MFNDNTLAFKTMYFFQDIALKTRKCLKEMTMFCHEDNVPSIRQPQRQSVLFKAMQAIKQYIYCLQQNVLSDMT